MDLLRKIFTLAVLLWGVTAAAVGQVTTPEQEFGFQLGADYHLASYQQLVTYWRKLERESDRLQLEQIGTTAEGRPMLMAIITSPENHANRERYQQIAKTLAQARGLTDSEARALSREGRAIVWIDGGLHATEVLGAQQLMEIVYQMVSRSDDETLRFLDDVILLAACVNPDGLDLVTDWYMRHEDPKLRTTRHIPRLYHKYVGHDNNRDFYMVTQPETEAINSVLFRQWYPQIAFNHHQTGPSGTVLFAPPFRDPFNYNIDPLIITTLDLVGAAIHTRFLAEGKLGATMRGGASYSTWWNGGLRTTQYFHNIVGLLTETIGNPTPIEIPLVLRRQLPSGDLPAPIRPQKWHFRQSVEYSISANRAVLDVASRYREALLFNIYRMARNSIERGSRDHWTPTPERIAALRAAADTGQTEAAEAGGEIETTLYDSVFHDPDKRDPRGYILPSDQPDFITAGKFINALIKNGVDVLRAREAFQVQGRAYPAGSYVVKTNQAFRPHILDMFEPQHHPDDIPYPGGAPNPPYDSAGWTLAYQMGVVFDRILDGFEGPFEEIREQVSAPKGRVSVGTKTAGYLFSHQVNDSFIALNRLLQSGRDVYWAKSGSRVEGEDYPAGTMYVPEADGLRSELEVLARQLGLQFHGITSLPSGSAFKLRSLRIGLWDRYGGSMPSGWIRWILEQFEFPFELVYTRRLNAGDLRRDFDALVFVGGSMPGGSERRSSSSPDPNSIPAEYHEQLGEIDSETIDRLEEFLKKGGAVLAIGTATALAQHLELPLSNALTQRFPDGTERPLGREQYYVPGSILRARVNTSHPLAYGFGEWTDFYFDNNPVFRLSPEAADLGVSVAAWFDTSSPLRSGWAWGQSYLKDTVAVAEVLVGEGKLFLFGPEITFRAQPHSTFKFLFNGLYYGTAQEVEIR